MAWPVAAAIAGGSALSFLGGQQQNQMSEASAKAYIDYDNQASLRAMDFSAAQAQKQMDFQERMSGTAHQREVEDLRSAGLNPLLSMNAGASSPAGAAGDGSKGSGSTAPVVPELSAIASSVRDSMSMMNEFRSSKAQSDLAKASAKKVGVETDLAKEKGPEAEWDSNFYSFMNKLMARFTSSSAMEGYRNFKNAGFGDTSIPDAEYRTDQDSRIRLEYAPGR